MLKLHHVGWVSAFIKTNSAQPDDLESLVAMSQVMDDPIQCAMAKATVMALC